MAAQRRLLLDAGPLGRVDGSLATAIAPAFAERSADRSPERSLLSAGRSAGPPARMRPLRPLIASSNRRNRCLNARHCR